MGVRRRPVRGKLAYRADGYLKITLGFFTLNLQGLEGAVPLMTAQGMVFPALFLLAGRPYDRHKTLCPGMD